MTIRTLLFTFAAAILVPSYSARADDAPVTIGGVGVEMKTSTVGSTKGHQYLRVKFTPTVNVKIEPKMTIRVKAKAKVGAEWKENEISALGVKLETIEPGQASKEMSVPLFMTEGLASQPEKVTLNFVLVKSLEKDGTALGQFCWNGTAVEAGACAE